MIEASKEYSKVTYYLRLFPMKVLDPIIQCQRSNEQINGDSGYGLYLIKQNTK